MEQERRQTYRVDCEVNTEIKLGKQLSQCKILDISIQGAKLLLENPDFTYTTGDNIVLTIPNDTAYITVNGSVIDSTQPDNSKVLHVMFTYCFESDSTALRQYVNKLQIHKLKLRKYGGSDVQR